MGDGGLLRYAEEDARLRVEWEAGTSEVGVQPLQRPRQDLSRIYGIIRTPEDEKDVVGRTDEPTNPLTESLNKGKGSPMERTKSVVGYA